MAESCQQDGCSVEAVSNLLDQLKAKKTELEVKMSRNSYWYIAVSYTHLTLPTKA